MSNPYVQIQPTPDSDSVVDVQVLTVGSGTWTKPAGVKTVKVIAVGAGGGGGGASNNGATIGSGGGSVFGAGGGGAGGYVSTANPGTASAGGSGGITGAAASGGGANTGDGSLGKIIGDINTQSNKMHFTGSYIYAALADYQATTINYINEQTSKLNFTGNYVQATATGLTAEQNQLLTNIATYTGQMHFTGDAIQAVSSDITVGAIQFTYNVKLGGVVQDDVLVEVYSDSLYTNKIKSGRTNSLGNVLFGFDLTAGTTIYLKVYIPGYAVQLDSEVI